MILILALVLSLACGQRQTVTAEETHAGQETANRQKTLKTFLACRIVPKLGNAWDYTFEPGQFPNVEWDRPHTVARALGQFQLHVRWFDGALNEVTSPENPGRYAFYAEGKTSNGMVVRRASEWIWTTTL